MMWRRTPLPTHIGMPRSVSVTDVGIYDLITRLFVQFYMQTYAVGVGSLSNTTTAFVTGMSDVVTNSMPGVQFGAYAGYVECVVSGSSFAQ